MFTDLPAMVDGMTTTPDAAFEHAVIVTVEPSME
jgi:hypothetical protein